MNITTQNEVTTNGQENKRTNEEKKTVEVPMYGSCGHLWRKEGVICGACLDRMIYG